MKKLTLFFAFLFATTALWAETGSVAGDFNGWNTTANQSSNVADNCVKVVVNNWPGGEFKVLVNGGGWYGNGNASVSTDGTWQDTWADGGNMSLDQSATGKNIEFTIAVDNGHFCATIATGTGDGGGGNDDGSDCQDGPYGVQVNGKDIYAASPTGEADYEGRTQYKASVELKANDKVCMINTSCNATWAIENLEDIDGGVNFTRNGSTDYTCNKAGCYTFYIKLAPAPIGDALYIGFCDGSDDPDDPIDPDDPNKRQDYASSVPSQCGDVMLQAFYYDSYSDTKTNKDYPYWFGNTRWNALMEQSSEIGAYFDIVWLPPSAKSGGGTGYHPKQYSNQSSDWGSAAELDKFIKAMHASNTKVVADIVINHAESKSSWCDFFEQDFGVYGTFQPDASWICNTDEVNSAADAGKCKGAATGPDDGGYNMQDNYGSARDWAHAKTEVQNMFKAYLTWMKNVVGYDGWRYDYAQGFKGKYINMYNSAAKNYFSVVEFWNGDPNNIKAYLGDVNWNTLAFDFGTKYQAIQGIADSDYSKCKGSGLLGLGLGKHAVTFVDNHDTFMGCIGRDSQDEMLGCGNSMNGTDYNKSHLLQANAFILSMPGVPCVFYPHWKIYKDEIKPMIMARHAAGVHSESSVEYEEAEQGGYAITVHGKKGDIRLLLGNKTSQQPAGFTKACSGNGYAIWYTGTAEPVLLVSPGTTKFKDNVAGLTITMAVEGVGGSGSIYYTLDGSEPTASSTKYTGPITIKETTTLKAFAVIGSAKTAVQTYTYTYQAPQTWPITVKFYKPASWEKVCLYAWSTDGAETKYMGTWPGTELTNEKDGWYSHTFDAEIKEVNFIFNCGNGCEQSGDLWTDEDVCYSWSGGGEKLEETCEHTAVKQIADDAMLTIYPNPTRGTLYLSASKDMESVEIYSCMGALVARRSVNATSETLDVNDLQSGLYILHTRFDNGTTAISKFVKQ